MVHKKIDDQIKRGSFYLKFYDTNKRFPFKKSRIYLTLSEEALIHLNNKKNKSAFIQELILRNKK